jgi:glycosyltransferase involved in cell wall biosynthesis
VSIKIARRPLTIGPMVVSRSSQQSRERNDMTPRVSLVVIAYNEREHAAACIDAILSQRVDASFEVILVDDGSTDGTAEVATAAAAGDDRFRLVRQLENRGRGAARAAGVEAARGSAIGFVDADVVLPPDWLARCLVALPGHAAVGGIAVPDGYTAVLARVSGAAAREVGGSMPVTGSNVLFDGSVLAQIGFDPRDRLGEDFKLSARLLKAGHRLARVPGLVARHQENKSYFKELRWRFDNGVHAAAHPREVGLRFADVVWLGWLGSWIVGIGGGVAFSPQWLLLGPAASVAAGVLHATSRFKPRPIAPFLIACMADVPLLTSYFVGRIVGIPRLLTGSM